MTIVLFDHDIAMVVLIDNTDTFLTQPHCEHLEAYLNRDDIVFKDIVIRLAIVGDIVLDDTYTYRIKGANRFVSNKIKREREVQAVINKICAKLDEINERPRDKKESWIFRNLIEQLNWLNGLVAHERILIAYTDLANNRPGANFYDPQTLKMMQERPEALIEQLEDSAVPKRLSSIHQIIVVNKPRPEDNKRFRIISKFYRDYLILRGAPDVQFVARFDAEALGR